jgi:acyl carrier protein
MESAIKEYISRELVSDPELLPLENDTPLLVSGILDSLSVLKLVLFFDEQFGIVVASEDVIPEHFETIEAICTYLRAQHQVQGVRE